MAGRIVENKQRFYSHNGKWRLCNRTQCCCYEISTCHSQYQKISGTSFVSNKTLYEYANRDKAFLQEQIRGILHPNIIVCGGGKGTVLNIAKNIIYEDESFREINYFCHYSRKLNILLIDSFHPSARINSYWKIEDMMLKVHEFILETDPPFMK